VAGRDAHAALKLPASAAKTTAERQESKTFFFEKKNQKTFGLGPVAVSPAQSRSVKVFAVIFREKPLSV
jgi:hypothetical protein